MSDAQPTPSALLPSVRDDDDDDVAWALQTAHVQWSRGTPADALTWLERAVAAVRLVDDAWRTAELENALVLLREALTAPAPEPPPVGAEPVSVPARAAAQPERDGSGVQAAGGEPLEVEEEEVPLSVEPLPPESEPLPPLQEPQAWVTAADAAPSPSAPFAAPRLAPLESLGEEPPEAPGGRAVSAAPLSESVDDLGAASAAPAPRSPFDSDISVELPPALRPPVAPPSSHDAAALMTPIPGRVRELLPFEFDEPAAPVTRRSSRAPASAPSARPAPPPPAAAALAPGAREEPAPFSGGARPRPPAPTAAALSFDLELLGRVEGLQDLPEEAHEALLTSATRHALEQGEELGQFAVALVLSGAVAILPTIADFACARAGRGDVVLTRGTLTDAVELRVVATEPATTVVAWKDAALAAATAHCPWVAEELSAVADRFQALGGATMGVLGERLDEALFAQITGRCELRQLAPRELLFTAGGELSGLAIVGAGRLERLSPTEAVEEELGPGDLVFPGELMSQRKVAASVRAGAGGALLLFAERKVAHELMVSVPPLLEILAS